MVLTLIVNLFGPILPAARQEILNRLTSIAPALFAGAACRIVPFMDDILSSLAKVGRAIYGALERIAQGRTGGVAGLFLSTMGGLGILLGLVWLFSPPEGATPDEVEGQFFEIGTGAVTGTYYPLGQTVQAMIANPGGSVRCADETRCGPPGLIPIVQATEGSVANVTAVHGRRLQSAFAQANTLHQAWTGDAPFNTPMTDLRAISGLYQETVHLVVARGGGIASLDDLRGRRVSIDRAGSGTYGIARDVLAAAGLGERDLTILTTPADQSAGLLIAGDIDAFFFVAGAPTRAVAGLSDLHLIDLVPIEGDAIEALIERQPYLTRAVIPGSSYLEVEGDIPTIGVTSVWVVHQTADFELIYRITRALWSDENRALLQRGPVQARGMTPETAIEGVPIPFHPGAEHYYREAGLLADE